MIVHVQIWTVWLFVYVGMPLAWASVGLHLLTPWYRTTVGRHLLSYALIIAAIMSFTSTRYWFFRREAFPDWLQYCQFGTYAALIFVMGWRVWLQARSLRRSSSEG
jgi:phosphatidylserine synthase